MAKIQNIIIILCLYFSAYASLASDSVNSLALYAVLPLAFVLSLLKKIRPLIKKGEAGINKYETILLILFAWIFYSYFWADYADAASRELHRCLGAILLSFILAVNATEKKMLPWLYLTYLVLFFSAWYYAQNNIAFDIEVSGNGRGRRMNDLKLNANMMACYVFYASFVIFIGGEFLENVFWKKLCRCAFWALFPLSFFIALATASRQVLIMQIPFLAYMLYSRYWKGLTWIYRTISIVVLIVVALAFSGYVNSLYNHSYLAVRSEKNLTKDSRILLMEDAFNVGVEHFPVGVGAGNYMMYSFDGHFSHNSYLELLANQGIVGVFLFLGLLGVFFKNQISGYMRTKDKNYLLFFVFGALFAFYNFFYVFYIDLWLISFFILVATHSEIYSQKSVAYENK